LANREQLPVPCDTMNLELKLRDPQLPQPKAAGFCVSGAMSVLKLSGFLPGRSRQISRCGSDNPFSRTFSACYLNPVASDHCVRYLAQLAACSLIATGSSRSAVLLICSHKSKFTIFQENVMTQNAWKYVIAVSLFSAYTLAAVPLFGQALTQPVQVVNTPNVNVVNTPSVSVTNTPSVSVSNTPSVNVANTPTVALEAGAGVNVSSPARRRGQSHPTGGVGRRSALRGQLLYLFCWIQQRELQLPSHSLRKTAGDSGVRCSGDPRNGIETGIHRLRDQFHRSAFLPCDIHGQCQRLRQFRNPSGNAPVCAPVRGAVLLRWRDLQFEWKLWVRVLRIPGRRSLGQLRRRGAWRTTSTSGAAKRAQPWAGTATEQHRALTSAGACVLKCELPQ